MFKELRRRRDEISENLNIYIVNMKDKNIEIIKKEPVRNEQYNI